MTRTGRFIIYARIAVIGSAILGVGSLLALLASGVTHAYVCIAVLIMWGAIGLIHAPLFAWLLRHKSQSAWIAIVLCACLIGIVCTFFLRHPGGLYAIGTTIGCLWIGVILARIMLVDVPVPDAGQCKDCGYDLRGLTVPRCPECGLPFVKDAL